MDLPLPAALVTDWEANPRAAPGARLAALLATVNPAEALARQTPGGRNQLLLRLHAALSSARIEGCLTCPCGAVNEFPLPVAAILALPPPEPRAQVTVAGRRFRLPLMADIAAALTTEGDFRVALAELCAEDPGPAPDPAALAAAFEAADPAAHIAIDFPCVDCGRALRASVDIAAFVARDLDIAAGALFRDTDCIARAYGWSEAEILALPPARRQRYVALIGAASVSGLPANAWPANGGAA